ncbi:MAG: GDSL-type esterase/lipase family protein, partial [Chloroflexota bacterium]
EMAKKLGLFFFALGFLMVGLNVLQAQTELDQFVYLPLIVVSDGTPEITPTVSATLTATPTHTAIPTPTLTPQAGIPAGSKILPLGDSRVQGSRPEYESYRYELWKNLIDNGWSFDFVGQRTDGASYDDYLGQPFDTDHEGTSGATTTDILNTLSAYQNNPNSPSFDVVLLGIGGNDLIQFADAADVFDRINQIIDELQTLNPNVVIFVEQIAPGLSILTPPNLMDQYEAYNADIATLATAQTDGSSTVIVIDMTDGWSDAYLADPVHYNAAGAKFIADKYDAALEAFYSTDQ